MEEAQTQVQIDMENMRVVFCKSPREQEEQARQASAEWREGVLKRRVDALQKENKKLKAMVEKLLLEGRRRANPFPEMIHRINPHQREVQNI